MLPVIHCYCDGSLTQVLYFLTQLQGNNFITPDMFSIFN